MYTIQFLSSQDIDKRDKVLSYLNQRLIKEGIFRATLTPAITYGKGGVMLPVIFVKPVRLINKKEYCGQHFGICPTNTFLGSQKKKKSTCLEYDDWIKF